MNASQNSTHYFLTTPRLGFRRWTDDDLPLARALWGDPRVTALIGGPFSDAAVVERLRAQVESDLQYWPIFILGDGAHAGCCGLRPYDGDTLEIGFHLRPEQWGRGFGEEAARAIVDYAFDRCGARRLFAGHHPQNGASRRLLLKLNFEEIEPRFYAPTGLLHPSYLLTKRSSRDSRAPAARDQKC